MIPRFHLLLHLRVFACRNSIHENMSKPQGVLSTICACEWFGASVVPLFQLFVILRTSVHYHDKAHANFLHTCCHRSTCLCTNGFMHLGHAYMKIWANRHVDCVEHVPAHVLVLVASPYFNCWWFYVHLCTPMCKRMCPFCTHHPTFPLTSVPARLCM